MVVLEVLLLVTSKGVFEVSSLLTPSNTLALSRWDDLSGDPQLSVVRATRIFPGIVVY